MKNKIVFVVFLSLLFSICSFGQNDWENLDIKDEVKSMKEIDYKVVELFGEVKKTDVLKGENLLFNESGYVTIRKSYGANGAPINQTSFVYDENNSIVEQNISDKKGKLIGRITNEYNESSKRIFQSSYKFDGSLQSRASYDYIDHIQLKEIVTFDSNGDKKDLQVYNYHKRKQTKEVITINPKSQVRSNMMRYDKNDYLVESTVYDVMGEEKTNVILKYDDEGNMIESKFFNLEELVTKRKLKYNNLGFLVEEKVEYPLTDKKDLITYTYSFDNKENWIQMIKYVNSVPVNMKERTLVYFQSKY